MDYTKSVNRLMSLVDHERTGHLGPRQKAIYDLSRIRSLLESLGNPHTSAHTVHIAGTKGKGSTAALCDAALRAAGYRTGFYSSPHLHSFRERIRRDTEPISQAEFGALVEKVWPHQQRVSNNAGLGPVSLFEFMTAMSFQCFNDAKADFQTIEVGLGGRLDATNVVEPNVCVITSISRDHTAILGDSLSQIAGEKAGIIKNGSRVVIAPQPSEALEAVDLACQRLGAHPIHVGRDLTWQREAAGPDGQRFSVTGRLDRYQLTIPLLGSYQLENAATAVAALEVLREQGHAISPEAIQLGFAGVSWPCRMEVLSRTPQVVADGAHNLYSIESLLDSLPEYLSYHRLILVVGFSRDKNVEAMVLRLANERPVVFATGSRHPRSLSPSAVAARFRDLGTSAEESGSPGEALDRALAVAGENDLVLATGSLFVAAEVRETILAIEPEIYPDLLPSDRPARQKV